MCHSTTSTQTPLISSAKLLITRIEMSSLSPTTTTRLLRYLLTSSLKGGTIVTIAIRLRLYTRFYRVPAGLTARENKDLSKCFALSLQALSFCEETREKQ